MSTMNIENPVNPAELFSAKDLVIVLSGGGTGIGLAFTAALAASGASKIFILGRRLEALQDAAAKTNPAIVKPVRCDVSDPASIAEAVKAIEAETPFIDVLVNNAGIDGPVNKNVKNAQSIAELQQEMTKDWHLWVPAWQTNTASVVALSAAFLHLLDAGNARRGWTTGKREWQKRADDSTWGDPSDQRTSQIVTVASISAFNREVTAGLAYTASKAGAVALGKAMANFLAPWGIRSNIIAPGRFPSQLTAGSATTFPIHQIPHGSSGVYEDVASLILYLVGRSGQYINGAVQVLDGGRISVMPATY